MIGWRRTRVRTEMSAEEEVVEVAKVVVEGSDSRERDL